MNGSISGEKSVVVSPFHPSVSPRPHARIRNRTPNILRALQKLCVQPILLSLPTCLWGLANKGRKPWKLKEHNEQRHRQVRVKRILNYFNYIIRYWKELAEEVTEPKLGLCLSTPAQWEPRFPLNSVCVIFLPLWPSQYISMLKTVYPSSFFTPGVCHQVANKITLRTFSHQFFTLPP